MTPAVPSTTRRFAFNSLMGRAVLLVPSAMALWWFVLKGASLWLLRMLAYVPLGLMIAPGGHTPVRISETTGEWLFNVTVNATGINAATGQPQFVDSLEFAVDENSVAYFAAGWFAYLALAGAAGAYTRSQAKQVLKGLGLQTAINILSLAAYVYINGLGTVINTPNNPNGSMWLINYVYHLIYLVVPFACPFMVALTFHPKWREYFATALPAPVQRGRRP